MSSENKIKVKVCGITTMNEVAELVKLDIDYLGFIFVQKSKRYIDKENAKKFIDYVKSNSDIKTVGVFLDASIDEVIETQNYAGLDVVQLHGNEDDEYILNLKNRTLPEIWKAVSADSDSGAQQVGECFNNYDAADAILLDSGKGGTGKTFNWQKYKDIGLNRRIILAGGISIENVNTACEIIKPEIVDINSRVEDETTGKKDIRKIKEFLYAVSVARQKRPFEKPE